MVVSWGSVGEGGGRGLRAVKRAVLRVVLLVVQGAELVAAWVAAGGLMSGVAACERELGLQRVVPEECADRSIRALLCQRAEDQLQQVAPHEQPRLCARAWPLRRAALFGAAGARRSAMHRGPVKQREEVPAEANVQESLR